MFIKSAIAVALLATSVAAQGSLLNSTIDPNTVDPTTRSMSAMAQELEFLPVQRKLTIPQANGVTLKSILAEPSAAEIPVIMFATM